MAKKTKKKTKKTSQDVTPRLYRDAQTGRFVSKKYAKKNRKTTLKAW
jgi:hypothetical protein